MVVTEMKIINHMYEASHLVYNGDLNPLSRKTAGPQKGPHFCGCCLVFCHDLARELNPSLFSSQISLHLLDNLRLKEFSISFRIPFPISFLLDETKPESKGCNLSLKATKVDKEDILEVTSARRTKN